MVASWARVDFPRTPRPASNRAEEDALGASRAYLVGYGAEDLINWSLDEQGNYESVVLRTSSLRQDAASNTGWTKETRWAYYDKHSYRIYRQAAKANEQVHPELIDEGRHGLAGLGRVPLFPLQVTEGLWLMNKAALLQLEHFNKSNALGWALTMGLFAMPVVYSDREWKQSQLEPLRRVWLYIRRSVRVLGAVVAAVYGRGLSHEMARPSRFRSPRRHRGESGPGHKRPQDALDVRRWMARRSL